MNKKNDDAFLKSIIGTSPIKKNFKLKKLPESINNNKLVNKKILVTTKKKEKPIVKIENKSIYRLEKTTINKKLKKGKVSIDIKIDFHGMSLIDAEALFVQTINSCYKKNMRCILFVTGKGVLRKKTQEDHSETKLYYGKIRNNFYEWAQKDHLQKYILSVQGASLDYGGDGAFFVYLRKQSLSFA